MGQPSSGCGSGSTGTATQAVPQLGHSSDCLTPAARGSHRSRVLSPLLPPKTPLYVYGSLSVSSPHVVEPDCSADPGIWSDLHLWRSNRSEYSHGRYAWIRGASSRPHPSRFLHLEHTPSGGPSTPRATCIPITSASHVEGLTTESCYEPAGSDAADSRVAGSYFAGSGAEGYGTTGSHTVGSKVTSPTATGSSDGATLAPATPILWKSACNPISAGGATASQAQGERSHL